VLEGELAQKGEEPFEDRWGALTYKKEAIEQYDWIKAIDSCRWQQDTCRLMGKDAKKGQKILKNLDL
jgi:hypothetical protein